MASVTPMMQQYLSLKEKYSDCILFFRLGDFYEMFFEDAKLASHELELTLTGKDCGLEERAPMCGVPFHSATNYINRLVEKGYKVAICEQTSDPAMSKGLVEREVVRVVTPGTVLDSAGLNERENNYLLSVFISNNNAGLAYADVSTGEFYVHQISDVKNNLADEIARIKPSEIITNDVSIILASSSDNIVSTEYEKSSFAKTYATETLLEHFKLQTLETLGLDDEKSLSISAAGALMKYLCDTQKNTLSHITDLKMTSAYQTMMLDKNTRRNLELTESLRGRSKKGSLLWILDKTVTPMGSRLLRTWIEQPLISKVDIEQRLRAIETLMDDHLLLMTVRDELKNISDIERLLCRISYGSINARDCLALLNSFSKVPIIKQYISSLNAPLIQSIEKQLDSLPELTDLLRRSINPDAPVLLSEGGIIKEGYDQTLDSYREASTDGKQWLIDLEQHERQETGIKNLKILYNRVFGYYIEVTKSNYDLVPLRYKRKQTLANAERFVTPELYQIEQKIVSAQEQAQKLELKLFALIRDEIAKHIKVMQDTANALKTLDTLISLAYVAVENRYVRPQIVTDGVLEIKNGRHPVVEHTLDDNAFIPNDTTMNTSDQRMLIITGPNMAGKSTYMRQVALIVLMAHVGSFVPAQSAYIPIVDRIFTRIGASDDLASGQSTFMLEMTETAYILRNATKDSLVILDEIGRGTSTFDGLSIAWSVVEYLTQKAEAKTLFATHYHELSELEGSLSGVANYCISVIEKGEDVIFLRKIIRGGADKSFGIHVARLAGVPPSVLIRAHEIQARLEVSNFNQNSIGQNILEVNNKQENEQIDLFNYEQKELIEEMQNIDVMTLTPMDAINKLFLLREKARKI